MKIPLIVFSALVLVALLSQIYAVLHIRGLRRRGIYPQKGQARASDIVRLLQSGYRVEAMRCHREVYGSSLRAAKEAVERMRP